MYNIQQAADFRNLLQNCSNSPDKDWKDVLDTFELEGESEGGGWKGFGRGLYAVIQWQGKQLLTKCYIRRDQTIRITIAMDKGSSSRIEHVVLDEHNLAQTPNLVHALRDVSDTVTQLQYSKDMWVYPNNMDGIDQLMYDAALNHRERDALKAQLRREREEFVQLQTETLY